MQKQFDYVISWATTTIAIALNCGDVVIKSPVFEILAAAFISGFFGGLVAHFVNNEKAGAATNTAPRSGWFLYPSWFESRALVPQALWLFCFLLLQLAA